uniref:Peptidase_M13 domain-containing protein n=2 Tax=Bursaphelenchus xylophilus TaxID=6326 RepID=A0A1I7S2U3_BURXY
MTAQEANNQVGLIDFPEFLKAFVKDEADEIKTHVLSADFKIRVDAVESTAALSKFLESDAIDGRTIINHLYFYLLRHYLERFTSTQRLGDAPNETSAFDTVDDFVSSPSQSSDNIEERANCVMRIISTSKAHYLTPLVERAYLEGALPTAEERNRKVQYVAEIVENLFKAFRTQLEEVDWTINSKNLAYEKLANMRSTLVYAENIFNDTYLSEKFASYQLDPTLTYAEEEDRLALLIFKQNKRELLKPKTRDTMAYPTYVVNAANLFNENKIEILNAFLDVPLFDMDFPASAVYGGVGSSVGHEIIHGFDSDGIHYDKNGDANEWMDEETRQKFGIMARCVVDQFNKFITSHNTSNNGEATQGENIADSGGKNSSYSGGPDPVTKNVPFGILASYRTYKAYAAAAELNPPLPFAELQSLTNDQIFFISYARFFCQKPPLDIPNLSIDMHAEGKLRVLGTLQNTPEFKEAFKCNVGDLYAPKEHCNVYRKAPTDKPC